MFAIVATFLKFCPSNLKALTNKLSVLVSVSVLMALSAVFHSVNSLHNSPLSHSLLPVLILWYWSFQLYFFMKVSFRPDIILCG